MPGVVKDFSYPFLLLQKWMQDAKSKYDKLKITNYNAAILATVSQEGQPSSRVILIKEIDNTGLVFFTNLNSKKAQEIQTNNLVSLLFYWEVLKRQVRIEGYTEPISEDEANGYFVTRPYLSKVGAWASKQSEEMKSRSDLEKRVLKYTLKYKLDVPRPDFWSGFRVIPNYFEFWESINFRLHKRKSYTKRQEGYKEALLYP